MYCLIELPNEILLFICKFINAINLMKSCKRMLLLISYSENFPINNEYKLFDMDYVFRNFCKFLNLTYVNEYSASYKYEMIRIHVNKEKLFIPVRNLFDDSNITTFCNICTHLFLKNFDSMSNKLEDIKNSFQKIKKDPIVKHLYFRYSDDSDFYFYFYDKEYIELFCDDGWRIKWNKKVIDQFSNIINKEQFRKSKKIISTINK
jgi:hypothetical protein